MEDDQVFHPRLVKAHQKELQKTEPEVRMTRAWANGTHSIVSSKTSDGYFNSKLDKKTSRISHEWRK